MITEKINGHTVEMYAGIEELPFARFQEYTRALLIDAGVGADMDSFARHIANIRQYNADGDKASVDASAMNLLQSVHFALERISPHMLAFAALVATIDGKPCDDLSDAGLKATSDALIRTGGAVGKLRGIFSAIKKNWIARWFSFSHRTRGARAKKNTTAS